MGKKTAKSIGISTGIAFGLLILLMAAAYVGLAEYYRGGFSYGTWINGIYCTGKTVDEVNKVLLQSCSYGGLTICDREGRSCRIEAEALDFSFDFKDSLNFYLEKQNPYRWIDNLFSAARRELTPVISYKEENLLARLKELPAFSGEQPEAEKKLETSIVTGNTGRRMGTPEGVNYVYGKQENRVLRGPGYASHVNFWMPVKGNIGIHAAWRSEYGKEIYKTNGSHGCINTPYDAMSKLYGMAKVGTPVVMFY